MLWMCFIRMPLIGCAFWKLASDAVAQVNSVMCSSSLWILSLFWVGRGQPQRLSYACFLRILFALRSISFMKLCLWQSEMRWRSLWWFCHWGPSCLCRFGYQRRCCWCFLLRPCRDLTLANAFALWRACCWKEYFVHKCYPLHNSEGSSSSFFIDPHLLPCLTVDHYFLMDPVETLTWFYYNPHPMAFCNLSGAIWYLGALHFFSESIILCWFWRFRFPYFPLRMIWLTWNEKDWNVFSALGKNDDRIDP